MIAGGINGQYLREILGGSLGKTNNVKIAIAYASGDPEIFNFCYNNNIKLTFWGRYDGSVPVTANILETFLKRRSLNYVCKLIPDIFHAKVIWWEGYGVYFGSANLTDNAWYGNIEAGIFLSDEDIIDNDIESELINFFDEIDKMSTPLTEEIYKEQKMIDKHRKDIDDLEGKAKTEFEKKRLIKRQNHLTVIYRKTHIETMKNNFLKEWYDTLTILRDISYNVSTNEYRPAWIDSKVPRGVQLDQFLHAYYYSKIKQGNRALHHQFYEKNKNNPQIALNSAMTWWKSLKEAPHGEDIKINEWAPFLIKNLDKDKLLSLSEDEFVELCGKVHALRDHSLRVKYTAFGFSKRLQTMDSNERIELLGRWLYKQRSEYGKSVLEAMHYMLYGGQTEYLPERLWEVVQSSEWKIPHLGVSSLGEIVGWAMPDKFPPRNGRTSKALTALGYKVKIHSE